MKIINESKKEKLPITFLSDFISNGWTIIGNLKADKDAIKKEFAGGSKVAEVIQDLIDAYTIAVGRMTDITSNKDYLNVTEETVKNAEKNTLSEDLVINIDTLNLNKEDISAVGKQLDELESKADIVEPTELDMPLADGNEVFELDETEPVAINNIDCGASDDPTSFICDFDDIPVTTMAVTDTDIYDEEGRLKI